MELFNRVLELFTVNIIYCLIPIILTLILVEIFFKNRFETKKVLNLIKWTIIIYTIISWLAIQVYSENSIPFEGITGPYSFAFWIMLFGSLVLPFSLIVKKLGQKTWYILLVSLGMKVGIYFERFVIIMTSLHRDFDTEQQNLDLLEPFLYNIGLIFLQGVIIAIITIGMFEFLKRKNIMYNNG